jgi:hypothetical protein
VGGTALALAGTALAAGFTTAGFAVAGLVDVTLAARASSRCITSSATMVPITINRGTGLVMGGIIPMEIPQVLISVDDSVVRVMPNFYNRNRLIIENISMGCRNIIK